MKTTNYFNPVSITLLVVPQQKNAAHKRITGECTKFKRCPVQNKPSIL